MIRTNIYLTKPEKAALQKLARKKGISVAELVRRAIDKVIEKYEERVPVKVKR